MGNNNIQLNFIKSYYERKANKIKNLSKIAKDSNNNKELKKVSEDFASLFIKQMLNELKKSVHFEKDPLYGGLSEDIWRDMLYDQYSKLLAKNGLNSLSELIYEALKQYK